jgi:hypothetical protein
VQGYGVYTQAKLDVKWCKAQPQCTVQRILLQLAPTTDLQGSIKVSWILA